MFASTITTDMRLSHLFDSNIGYNALYQSCWDRFDPNLDEDIQYRVAISVLSITFDKYMDNKGFSSKRHLNSYWQVVSMGKRFVSVMRFGSCFYRIIYVDVETLQKRVFYAFNLSKYALIVGIIFNKYFAHLK